MLRPLRPMVYSMTKFQCLDYVICNSFSTLPRIQLPSPKEIHLWYIKPSEVKDESLLNQYKEILSPAEKDKVSQMSSEELRKNALLARALVRTTIARYQINSQVCPKSLNFVTNAHGKPEVDWQYKDILRPAPLHFNMSHTSSLIACAVAVDSPIGLDVEEKNRVLRHNIMSFAKRFFTKHELQVLSAISDPQVQHQELIKLWTLKEAYVKASGRGFSGAPFRSFTIQIKDGRNGSLMGNFNSEVSQKDFIRCNSLEP
ncbi:OLC1v1034185C1 [Oldenlandia corymbosa var. corymbosa]|uniref:holo-[acyl-carrier-protein] synthase n=1 Tax=Oldenlandia corymbosa var. corymbosa TaxID=529605 RepID=A0AAV1CRB4_OLDCO|nr:OLC1v1034185C1 [Oldenlandia corymbosa var. corymbosa]